MATDRQAQRAAEQHADALSAYPNVVGVGTRPVGEPGTPGGRRGGGRGGGGGGGRGGAGAGTTGAGGQHAVAVYVSRKVPDQQLADDERLPDHVEVSERGGTAQVPVVVVEAGAIAPEQDEAASPRGFTTE